MRIIIKDSAPEEEEQYNRSERDFGISLEAAFSLAGCSVKLEHWPNWGEDDPASVAIVLRGLKRTVPAGSSFKILWLLSYPLSVAQEELDAYDLVLVASDLHRGLLKERTETPVRLARLCIDPEFFYSPQSSLDQEIQTREGTIYVANSKGTRRDIAQWLLESRIPARIIGNSWGHFGLGHLVDSEHIPERHLPSLYRSARLGLTDHFMDMRTFGYINRQVLEYLACGLPVITNDFPEIRNVCGNAVLYANNSKDFRYAVDFCEKNYPEILNRTRDQWEKIAPEFTFDVRVGQILEWIENPPSKHSSRSVQFHLPFENEMEQILRSNIRHQEQTINFLESVLSRQEQELCELRRQYQLYHRLLKVCTEHYMNLEKHLTAVYSSSSWKITAPLRYLTGGIKAIYRGRFPASRREPLRPKELERALNEINFIKNSPNNHHNERTHNDAAYHSTRTPAITALRHVLPLPLRRVIRKLLVKLGFNEFVHRVSAHRNLKPSADPGQETRKSPGQGISSEFSDSAQDQRYWYMQTIQLLEEIEYLKSHMQQNPTKFPKNGKR